MDNDFIRLIQTAPKKTPVTLYIKEKKDLSFPNCKVFSHSSKIVFGDYEDIAPILTNHKDDIIEYHIENNCRHSAIPLQNLTGLPARIEPGAIIRSFVTIEEGVIVMMGAVINVGASIGKNTMIDMNAVIGGRAIIKENCHIGAGAVIAGVIEPSSATPVIIHNHVFIGANAVILEGIEIGEGAIVGAGSIVTKDVLPNTVVIGNPAKPDLQKNEENEEKTKIEWKLRNL